MQVFIDDDGAPAQSFAWDPSFTATQITLSGSNSVASTNTTSGGNNYEARGTVPKNSGKWQFELVVTAVGTASTNSFLTIGLEGSDISFPPSTTFPGMSGGGLFTRSATVLCRFYTAFGNNFIAITPNTNKIWLTGDIATVTVDFSTETVDIYRNGVLVTSQNVTNIDTALYNYKPCVRMGGVAPGTPTVVTIPAGLTYPVAGFTPWA